TQHLARIVRKVLRKSTQINYDEFLAFIAKVNPSHVDFSSQHYELATDSVEFLIHLADMMKSIFIFHECDSISHPSFNPIIISILSRKCEKLIIRDSCRHAFVSPSEAEQLLQCLHHSEKKFSLTLLRTHSELVNGQNGLYNVTSLTTCIDRAHGF
ncbi:hypothetical protein PRIPAC_91563, partial [Pristionchus pacificus]|uniref:Uncharacterized protein n=1 Tax=Pristionchus pacificus TaxID=54126 RepID=A0A2A6CI73_PRIPA